MLYTLPQILGNTTDGNNIIKEDSEAGFHANEQV